MPKLSEQSPRAAGERWSSRSVGSNWQHQSFYLLIWLGGRRAAYLLLYPVVACYALFSRLARRRAGYYLQRRFLQSGGLVRLGHCYRLLLGLGKALVDRAVVGIRGPQDLDIKLGGREELIRLRDENRGLIMMTAHVGCWQAAMAALGFLQRPVNLLMRRDESDIDRHYFEHAGSDCPYRIIDPSGYLGGTLEMLGALKQGEIVCVMGDRLLGSEKNTAVTEFLGAPAPLPFSAYKIAAATGAPVAVFFTWKDGPDSYRLQLARTIRVPQLAGRSAATFAPFVAEFAAALEEFCRQHPYQFFNFYDMWQKPDDLTETDR